MPTVLLTLPELRRRLSDAAASYKAGEFIAARRQVLELLEHFAPLGAGDERPPELEALRLEARLLALRCESRLEHFDQLVLGCSELLAELPRNQASATRANAMILLSYGQAQLTDPEGALSAAFVAVQDGLALDDRDLVAQALDRVALSYLAMGDGMSAERFMLEAIGFAEQTGDADTRLLRVSNALYMMCNLHDALLEAGDRAAAAALIQRSRRMTLPGEHAAAESRNPYLRCMWQANMARWLRRAGRPEAAADLLTQVRKNSCSHGWYAIWRPLQLEQAAVLEEQGRLQDAVRELESMFEPIDVPLRDPQALRVHQQLQRLRIALGQPDRAAESRSRHEELLVRSLRGLAQVHRHLPDLGAQITEMLAQADRQRLKSELARLRQLHEDGRGMVVPGHAWHRNLA